jgi:negative regulator of sigma E activity
MNGEPGNERLSALLDGELTDAERAALEQELSASQELQHELAELRRVSAAIKELPQIPAPAGLHGAVMAEIQQSVKPGNDRPAGSGRAGGRPGLTRLIGLSAAVALAVGAAVWFGQDRGQQIAENNSTAPEIHSVQQERPEALANRAEFRGSPDGQNPNAETVSVETRHQVLQISRDDLTAARVGDIIEAVDANGDSVGVIRLTVVDRKLGVEALQVLLSAHQFEAVDGNSSGAGNGLVAVYVESDREKLSQAIAEFRRKLKFGLLEVDSPVRVAELEPETRTELGIDKASGSSAASQRAVTLKPGSQLDRLVQSDSATTVAGEAPARDATPAVSSESPKPVRVIFVVVDGPIGENAADSKENGAA